MLLVDVIALITIEINRADRPDVTTASGSGDAAAVLVDADLAQLKTQLPLAQFPRAGQRSHTIGGSQLTLYSFELPATGTTARRPRAGTVYAAADIEGCSGPTVRGGAAKIDAQRLRLDLADGTKVPTGPAVKNPPLVAATVPAGKCTRGWIVFEVPENKRPSFLVYSGSSEIRWSVP